MVIMRLEIDNFLLFNNFSIDFSYTKKPVKSTIPNEYLEGRPNFRYKKLVVLMGANATGKTSLSRIMMAIFNFIAKKEYSVITRYIEVPERDASFSIDMAFSDHVLYRVMGSFKARDKGSFEYSSGDIQVTVQHEFIREKDNYERCLSRLLKNEPLDFENYIQALETVPYLTWKFEDPFAASGKQRTIVPILPELYAEVLEKTLHALDPRIKRIIKADQTENTFFIVYDHQIVIIKDGEVKDPEKLSSGTAEGIGIADLLTAMNLKVINFFFCDEKFSHIHSAAEKAFLSMMIDLLGPDQQLVITTHNSDILEMDIPFHSYAFLRRDENNDNNISCVFASHYLKKNTASLKNAVDNDLFSSAPDVDRIFEIGDYFREVNNEQPKH